MNAVFISVQVMCSHVLYICDICCCCELPGIVLYWLKHCHENIGIMLDVSCNICTTIEEDSLATILWRELVTSLILVNRSYCIKTLARAQIHLPCLFPSTWTRGAQYYLWIIFLSCGFFFLLLFLAFSNPPRSDVYHNYTHDVALEFRMQVWNMLHAACWKYRTQKITKNSPSAHHCTTLTGSVFATKAYWYIDNQKKLVKQQYLLHMSSQYGELWPTNGWDRFGSLGHPS